jgi:hypothetical protein
MATLKDADDKLTALGQQFSQLQADIQQFITDSGQSGPLVDSINAKLDALATAFSSEDDVVKAADPGQPA